MSKPHNYTLKNILKTYQKRLTNLSGRNKSLLLLNATKGNFSDIKDFHFTYEDPAFSVVSKLMERKTEKIVLTPTLDSRDESANKASKNVRAISRTERFLFEEQGVRDLYVGYPWVYGKLMNDTPVRCPLLFFPVELKQEANLWVLRLRPDVDVSFNKTFLLACSHFNDVVLEESFLETDFSDFPKDSQDFRTELYHLLENSPIELNFNQRTFEDHLQPFIKFTRKEFDQATQTGKLKVQPEAVLGVFPQAGSYLFPDYETLIHNKKISSLEDFFIPNEDDKVNSERNRQEESLTTPYALDAAQEKAIMSVKNGRSIVVQGPPGSGKSQMICNLIADGLADGKNILVVSQKRAALDVVYDRLNEKGFDEFAVLIHDFKGDRKPTYAKINHQIEKLEQFIKDNNSLDAIYLERQFLQASREIGQITDELEEFHEALYDTTDAGISAKELYLTCKTEEAKVKLRREYEYFPYDVQQKFVPTLQFYLQYAQKYDIEEYPWVERKSFATYQVEDQEKIQETVEGLLPYFQDLSDKIYGIISMHIDLDEGEWLISKEDDFRKLLGILEDEKVYKYFKNSLVFGNTDALWLESRKANLMSSFGEEGVEKSLDKKEIGYFLERLEQGIKAQKKWVERAKWKMFSGDRNMIEQAIIANQLEHHEQPLETLMRMLENRMNLEHNLTKLSGYHWLTDMPQNLEKEDFETWINAHIKALKAKELYQSLRNGIKYLEVANLTFDELFKKIDFMLNEVKDLPKRMMEWEKYLSVIQIRKIISKDLDPESMVATLEKDFEALCEFDKLKEERETHELDLIEKLREAQPGFEIEATLELFHNSLQNAWINHLEAKYPVLRIVSSGKIQQLEARLQLLVEEKRNLCRDIVLMKARERTYKDLEYNRLDNMVTYRDLKHQVNKKRQIWPLRKLISDFSHELLDLVPCWMASPESVSAIFPLEELFDLVIFDEASQCFAEKGIPAMFRGKQVVITGDSQQLAPYDLYRPRWEEDHDDDPALEVDSLLDLGVRYVPQQQLNGHYRSKFPALIHFSNQQFYAGKLRMVPHFDDFNRSEPALEYIRVEEGVWQKQTNQAEAGKVVEITKKLLLEGQEDIGIITFNFPQQELIRDLLEEANIALPERLFIKNIENVQGDEREVIIFSIAYAPSTDGKMRLMFGSLSMENGENRLNVAVTRARTKIYVVSSILPHQLVVEDALNDGPRVLKSYLQYAYDISLGKLTTFQTETEEQRKSLQLSDALVPLNQTNEKLLKDTSFADLSFEVHGKRVPQLVLTDDYRYHEAISPKDAHAYTPLLFEYRGWRARRFYSRQFWKQKDVLTEEFNRTIGNYINSADTED